MKHPLFDASVFVTNDEYHGETGHISKSGLSEIKRSPAHYWESYLNPDREQPARTDALITGDAFHVITLEPELFPQRFAVLKKGTDLRTTAGKSHRDDLATANPAATIIKAEVFDLVRRMADSVLKHPVASELLKGGFTERAFYATDPATTAKVKCKPDYYTPEYNIIVDLKSTTDASPGAFGKDAFSLWYHVQAAFYADVVYHSTRHVIDRFAFVAVEKEPPYAVAVYYVDPAVINFGRETYMKELAKYAECIRTNQWPAYSPQAYPLQLPAWAFKQQ